MKRLFYFPFLLILYEFVLFFSNDMFVPALPSLVGYMKANYTVIQLTVTFWLAGMTAISLFLCPLYERFGKRRVFLGAGVGFVFTTLICSAAHSPSFLLIVRFFQGASVCTFLIGGYSLIHELYQHHDALRMLKWIISVLMLSPMVGPLLGGVLLIFASWRLIFSLLFALGILVLIPLWLAMPYEASKRRGKKIFCGIHLKNIRFVVGGLSIGSMYGTLFIWITAAPFLFIDLLKYEPYQYGFVQLPIFGAFIVGFYFLSSITRKMKRHQIIHTGLFIAFAAALFLLMWNLYNPVDLLSIILPMSFVGLGFGLAAEPLYHQTLFIVKEDRKDGVVAALFFLLTAMATIATFTISLIDETFLSVAGVILIFTSLACLCEFGFER